MQLTDQELVYRIRQGDIRSFELVFHAYGADLIRYASTIVKNGDEAEDIVQQLFIGVWTKRESLDINTSLKSYLYKAVYNSSLNRIKQQAVKESYASYMGYVGGSDSATATGEIEGKEVSRAIENAINDLPEQCRLIFRMSRFEELKYQEIADKLNLSVKTVENQMGKALKHMRVRLKEYMLILLWYIILM